MAHPILENFKSHKAKSGEFVSTLYELEAEGKVFVYNRSDPENKARYRNQHTIIKIIDKPKPTE